MILIVFSDILWKLRLTCAYVEFKKNYSCAFLASSPQVVLTNWIPKLVRIWFKIAFAEAILLDYWWKMLNGHSLNPSCKEYGDAAVVVLQDADEY